MILCIENLIVKMDTETMVACTSQWRLAWIGILLAWLNLMTYLVRSVLCHPTRTRQFICRMVTALIWSYVSGFKVLEFMSSCLLECASASSRYRFIVSCHPQVHGTLVSKIECIVGGHDPQPSDGCVRILFSHHTE